jgi:hypothetical protein
MAELLPQSRSNEPCWCWPISAFYGALRSLTKGRLGFVATVDQPQLGLRGDQSLSFGSRHDLD